MTGNTNVSNITIGATNFYQKMKILAWMYFLGKIAVIPEFPLFPQSNVPEFSLSPRNTHWLAPTENSIKWKIQILFWG